MNGANDQSDSSRRIQIYEGALLNEEHIDFLTDKAENYWKHIAREIPLDESQIASIERNVNIRNKLREVITTWLNECCLKTQNENTQLKCCNILNILTACRLNKIKGKLY